MSLIVSDWRDLKKVEDELQTGGVTSATHTRLRDFMRMAREHAYRRSKLLHAAGSELLKRGGLPETERLLVQEQVVIAALDSGRVDAAEQALAPLAARFPKSNRVELLRGMVLEAKGLWEEAAALYDRILAATPAHEGAHKRKVAALRGQGKLEAAATALTTYLATWQADLEGWAELAELNIALGQHRQAAFCIEELLLAVPSASMWHTWYASVLATIGDADALRTAQKHYAAAIELSEGDDVRALFGAVAVAAALAKSGASSSVVVDGEDGDSVADLPGLAAERLVQLYTQKAPGQLVPLVKAALQALRPSK